MSQHDQTSQEHKPLLQWSATGHGWFVSTDEVSIFVPEHVYEKRLIAYLKSQGIERKSYYELMRILEAEWKRQCDVERTFQENLEHWMDSKEPGVSVQRQK